MACPHGQEGWASADILQTRRRGSISRDLYGRPYGRSLINFIIHILERTTLLRSKNLLYFNINVFFLFFFDINYSFKSVAREISYSMNSIKIIVPSKIVSRYFSFCLKKGQILSYSAIGITKTKTNEIDFILTVFKFYGVAADSVAEKVVPSQLTSRQQAVINSNLLFNSYNCMSFI